MKFLFVFCSFCIFSIGKCTDQSDQDLNKAVCLPLWHNQCLTHHDCCSFNCEKELHKLHGICGPSAEQLQKTLVCHPLWYSFCKFDEECCSKKCHRESQWRYGYCANNPMSDFDPIPEPYKKPIPASLITNNYRPIKNNRKPKPVVKPKPSLMKPKPEKHQKTIYDEKTCGRSIIAKIVPRIIEGNFISYGDFPFLVSIQTSGYDNKDFEHLCGGSIITQYHILTAAHCFENYGKEELQVIAGAHELYKDNEFQSIHNVTELFIHPKYEKREHDIAILKLATPIEFDDYKTSICLPSNSNDIVSGKVSVAGWGDTEARSAAENTNIAMFIKIPILKIEACIKVYKKFNITENMICAGEGKKDSCQGDSGGPLFQINKGVFKVYGIVSFGIGCGREKYPGIYTNVVKYLKWIHEKLEI